MAEGIIRAVKNGYAFIRAKEGGDVFFHFSGYVGTGNPFDEVKPGRKCIFEPTDGPKGPGTRAENVEFI